MQTCLIALGSNLSKDRLSPYDILSRAIWQMPGVGLPVTGQSRWYRTPAYPGGNGPDYLNAVVAVETDLDAEEVLDRLHRIEASLGRERGQRWSARVVDLDLLTFDGAVVPDAATLGRWIGLEGEARRTLPDQILLPHPRLQERAFVLVPLCDIAPDWHHPVLNRTAAEMLAELPEQDVASIRPVEPEALAAAP